VSEDVVSEFYVEASQAMVKMADEAARLADCFRGRGLQQGHDGLVALTTELRQFPVLVSVLVGPLGIDPQRLRVGELGVEQQLDRFGGWIESLIRAHEQSDWLTVADVLELDLEPLLRAWASTLKECLAAHEPAARGGLS
jgi:hypothetical protein